MSLREEIADQFDMCMGFHEGIKVPDHPEGERAIDYAENVIKLIEKRIDEEFNKASPNPNPEPNPEMYGYLRGLLKVKEMLK